MTSGKLALLTFNIGNPSPDRAKRQLGWLATRDEHILVLTETKASAGCRLLAEAFTAAGYQVIFPEPEPGDYGTMIVSNVHANPTASPTGSATCLPAPPPPSCPPPPGRPASSACTSHPGTPASRRPSANANGWPPATPRSPAPPTACR
jgi:hypothetical protein